MSAHTSASGTASPDRGLHTGGEREEHRDGGDQRGAGEHENICTKRGVSPGTRSRISPSAPPRIASVRAREPGVRGARFLRGLRTRGSRGGFTGADSSAATGIGDRGRLGGACDGNLAGGVVGAGRLEFAQEVEVIGDGVGFAVDDDPTLRVVATRSMGGIGHPNNLRSIACGYRGKVLGVPHRFRAVRRIQDAGSSRSRAAA